MRIFVSHINAHQILSTTQEALNNQVDKMTLVSLHHQPSQHWCGGPTNEMDLVPEMEDA